MAPSSLRPAPELEEPCTRITTAGVDGGGDRNRRISIPAPSASPGAAPAIDKAWSFLPAKADGPPGQRVTRGNRSRGKCGLAPRPPAAPSDAGSQPFAEQVRRRVDGTSDSGPADSLDPRASANKPRTGRFAAGIFSFDRPRPFSFRCLEKKMGADSPENFRSSPGPPGKGQGKVLAGSFFPAAPHPPFAAQMPPSPGGRLLGAIRSGSPR